MGKRKYKLSSASRRRRAAANQRWRRANPIKVLLTLARTRAKRKGLRFSLTVEDFPDGVPAICPVLGLPLVRGRGVPCHNSPTLDRIKPELGYVSGNVRIVSHRANSLKRDMTSSEARLIARDLRTVVSKRVKRNNS